jgi:glyoxylase-like metal-dependent hydrolase (beta-lactamase superfamily II)
MTETTRTLVREADQDTAGGPQDSRVTLLDGAELLSATAPTTVDLGGRRVRVVPRSGHTSSDVTVELDDPSIVFCGDLVWNEMFPNYVDAVPSALSASVRGLLREESTHYVPGHGPMADRDALNRFVMILDHVEAAARAAFEGGQSAAEAAAGYSLPPEVGEWFLFNPAYFERALDAWHRELAGTNG